MCVGEGSLTQTVVPIVGQHEAIIACAPVVPRDVDALMDTSTVVVILTLVHVWENNSENERYRWERDKGRKRERERERERERRKEINKKH